MSTGLIAAFGTLFCWTAGTMIFTIASQRTDPAALNRVRLVYATILLSLIVITLFKVPLKELFLLPTWEEWFWLGLSGIIGLTLGDFFAFSAFRILGSSRTSLFSPFAPVAALLLGMLMLNETINLFGGIGMLISIGGIFWFVQTTRKSNQEEIPQKQLLQGIGFAILGALGQGMGLVCAKKGLNITHVSGNDINPVHATWIRMFIGALAAYSLALFKRNVWNEFKTITGNAFTFTPTIMGTLFGPVAGVSLSLFAASQIPVGIAQTIFSLLPLTVMFAAIVSGREKLNVPTVIAALICLLGVVVLVWRDDLSALFSVYIG